MKVFNLNQIMNPGATGFPHANMDSLTSFPGMHIPGEPMSMDDGMPPPSGGASVSYRFGRPISFSTYARTRVAQPGQSITATQNMIDRVYPGVELTTIEVLEPNPNSDLVHGRVYIVGGQGSEADMTDAKVDIVIAPGWHAPADLGGGAIGGVRAALVRKADSLSDPHSQLYQEAIEEFETARDEAPGRVLQTGQIVVSKTGIQDQEIAPEYLIQGAFVPPTQMKKASGTSQEERMLYVESQVKSTLEVVKTLAESGQTELVAGDTNNPIRVALPILSTGPDGALSYQESAAILSRLLGKFIEANPGFEFIIPIYDGFSGRADFVDDADDVLTIFQNPQGQSSLSLPRAENAQQMFDRFISDVITPATDGISIDGEWVRRKYTTWVARFLSQVSHAKARIDLNDRVALRSIFGNVANQEAASQLHKNIQLTRASNGINHTDALDIELGQLATLLNKPKLAIKVWLKIQAKLARSGALGKFGGEKKINEIMAAAVGAVINEENDRLLTEMFNNRNTVELINKANLALQAELEAARRETLRVARELGLKDDEIRALSSQVEQANLDSEGLRDRLRQSLSESQTQGHRANVLRDRVDQLERQLGIQQRATQRHRTSTSTFRSGGS